LSEYIKSIDRIEPRKESIQNQNPKLVDFQHFPIKGCSFCHT